MFYSFSSGPETRLYPKPKTGVKSEEDKENIPIKSKLTKLKSAMKASKETRVVIPEPLSEKTEPTNKNVSLPEEVPEITVPAVKALTEEIKGTKWNPTSTIAPEDDLNEEDIQDIEDEEIQIEEVQAQDIDDLFPQEEQELISYSQWETETPDEYLYSTRRKEVSKPELPVFQQPVIAAPRPASNANATKALHSVKLVITCNINNFEMLEELNSKFGDFQAKIDQNLANMNSRFLLVEGKVRGIEDKTTQVRTPQKQVVNSNTSPLRLPSTPIQSKQSPAHEVRLDVAPSPTFITDVPESMIHPLRRSSSSTVILSIQYTHLQFQNAQQYILSIAQRFKETQELINSRKPSFFVSKVLKL